MEGAGMQIGADQAQFMQLLARAIGAKRYIEIGVFTGYSSLAIALALPNDGTILACDVSEEYTSVARKYWAKAGVEKKIRLVLAPALDTLDAELKAAAGTYDLAFIDGDKPNTDGYYERCLRLLRPGGILMVDNTLWDGRVADPANNEASTIALRAITRKAMSDSRVFASLTPVGDGVLLVLKR